jgi:hypothetical protein
MIGGKLNVPAIVVQWNGERVPTDHVGGSGGYQTTLQKFNFYLLRRRIQLGDTKFSNLPGLDFLRL